MNPSHIFIVLTPFQLRMMEVVYESALNDSKTTIYHTEDVTLPLAAFSANKILIPFENFSLQRLKKHPLKGLFSYRQRLGEIRNFWIGQLNELNPKTPLTIVIGSDKHNFTQVLLNLVFPVKGRSVSLIAVEEGLGYYIRENLKDVMISASYRWLTPLLFGELIRYHRQLGTDSRIAMRYVRLPEMIPPYRGKKLNGLTIIPNDGITSGGQPKPGEVLIFSFPEQDFGMTEKEKTLIIQKLADGLGKRKIFLKPHPRESLDVFEKFPQIALLDKRLAGEQLDYFNYELIVNFTSSVIIDILARGYPSAQIITVEMRKTGLAFFENTRIISLKELKQSKLEN